MKEIKNWEAKVLVEGEEKIALPLPGCIILGELDGEHDKINDDSTRRWTQIPTRRCQTRLCHFIKHLY